MLAKKSLNVNNAKPKNCLECQDIVYDHCIRCQDYICENCFQECEQCGGGHSPYCNDCLENCSACGDLLCIDGVMRQVDLYDQEAEPGPYRRGDGEGYYQERSQKGCLSNHDC